MLFASRRFSALEYDSWGTWSKMRSGRPWALARALRGSSVCNAVLKTGGFITFTLLHHYDDVDYYAEVTKRSLLLSYISTTISF